MRLRVGCLLALLMLTAGCNAFGDGPSQPTQTLTPAPVPTLEPTETEERPGVAPGISRSAVTDPKVLAEHHVAAINETRYVWEEHYREDRRYRNVTSSVVTTQSVVVESPTVYRHNDSDHEKWIDGQLQHLAGYGEYANGEVKYTSWIGPDGGERAFRRFADPSSAASFADLAAVPIRHYLAVDDATISRVDVEGTDRQYYLVDGTGGELQSVPTVENYSARAIVREDGFVRRLAVSYDARGGERFVHVQYNFTYSDVGTATVTSPAWAENASAKFDDG